MMILQANMTFWKEKEESFTYKTTFLNRFDLLCYTQKEIGVKGKCLNFPDSRPEKPNRLMFLKRSFSRFYIGTYAKKECSF